MSIRKKIVYTIVSFSLAVVVLIGGITLVQFVKARNDLLRLQEAESEKLYETNVDIMTESNKDMAISIASNYSAAVNKHFSQISGDLLTVKGFLEDCYASGSQAELVLGLDDVRLQGGTAYADVKDELQKIQPAKNLIANIAQTREIARIYYVSQSGMLISNVEIQSKNGDKVDRRERIWYQGALQEGGIYWTEVYPDARTGEDHLTCAVPVYHPDGTIAGVVAEDIFVSELRELILTPTSSMIQYSFLLSNEGNFIVGSTEDKTIDQFVPDMGALFSEMSAVTTGVDVFITDASMIGYAPVDMTKWYVGVAFDYEQIVRPATSVGNAILDINQVIKASIRDRIYWMCMVFIFIVVAVLWVVVLSALKTAHSIVNPIRTLIQGVNTISEGKLDYSIEVKSGDEVESLANAFNTMTVKLNEYMSNFREATIERERISAELSVAKTIQNSMLPCIFPPFPDYKEFDIYALMNPAKEVGGDFYDFFFVDKDRLAFVIADVSGKGIPAALFMVIAKTLMSNETQNRKDPAEVFRVVNNKLCENNDAGMFVTAFMGILNIKTGHFVFSNAGHNPPLLYRDGKNFDWLRTPPKLVLGGFKGVQYENYEMHLGKNDILCLYTDGVTEALNKKGELYSDSALKTCLNKDGVSAKPVDKILHHVEKSVKEFSRGAEQADDMTMLIIRKN